MKRYAVIFATILVFFSCTAPKQVVVAKETFNFDYVPKQSTLKPGSAGMVLAFVRPYYASLFTSGGTELFRRFREALSKDIEQVIIARGFTMKGPYAALDEMLIGEKKAVDLTINIEIEPEFAAVSGNWTKHASLLGPTYDKYTYSGTASLVGKINILGIEPLTNEKVWTKSVSIPNITNIQIETTTQYSRPLQGNEILQDPGIYNAIGKALTYQYTGIMDKIYAHFDPEELATHKDLIKELKSKKGY